MSNDVYAILSRLEAEGVIHSGLLSTKPISRAEATRLFREAEQNSEGRSGFIKGLVHSLGTGLNPFEADSTNITNTFYAKYIHTNSDVLTLTYGSTRQKDQALNHNNDGDLYDRGSNYRMGFTSRLEDLGPFSFYLNPELRTSDSTENGVLKTGYGVLGFSWIDIVLGRDSQWWGPGYNGSILLSSNAEPFTMIKFTAPEPLHLPWIFKYLGPFQYTLFATRLEKDRTDVSEPYLWGMRFDFKPDPIIEIGLERTGLMGGHGRPQGLKTWIRSFTSSGEHKAGQSGDQRGGYDLKLTLPFKPQPVQVYWEADGEDNIHGYPTQWAYLSGVYLPRVLSLERVSLRAEYASTHMPQHPGASWYTHGLYTSGYTYKGMIIGHHMGLDSRDVFFELSYLIPENHAKVSISYDRKLHNISQPVRETTSEAALTAEIFLTQHIEIMASYGFGRIENPGNAVGEARDVNAVMGGMQYRF